MKNYAKTFYDVEIEVYYEGSQEYPSIDVRCPNLRWYYDEQDIATRLGIPIADVKAVSEAVYEWEVGNFWRLAEYYAQDIWGEHIKVYALGRSGRHLCVAGLPEIFLWKKRQTAKWQKFAQGIEAWVDSYAELEVAAQLVADYLEIEMPKKDRANND